MRLSLRLPGFVLTFLLVVLLSLPITAQAQEPKKTMPTLAVVRADGNITLFDAEGQNPVALTRNANPRTRIYLWPTWSTDGRLAYFGASVAPGDSYRLRVFVVEKTGDPPQIAYSSEDDIFTYAYWSPGDCPEGDCRDLALLFTPSGGNGLAVRMIRDRDGQFTDKIIGEAAPFYYSFSPDGQKMLWHRFARQLDVYDVKGDAATKLDDDPGAFQAPMWSPVPGDERLLFAIKGSETGRTDIVIADGDERQTLLSNQAEPVSFAWSPDALHIASVAGSEKLRVTEVKTGRTVATSQEQNIIAHFWSPQSDRVAYLIITRDAITTTSYSPNGNTSDGTGRLAQAPPTLTWFVLDIKTGKAETLTSFIPTRDMIYYLNFFDQFARSHSLWSPDGRYLAYGSLERSGASNVMLADTRNPGKSVLVSDGAIGIWSWN